MDQLRELGREERKETLTDLFLDSILDPRYVVTIENCRLRDQISIHECFEAVCKYENIIARENIIEGNQLHTRRTGNNTNKIPVENTSGIPQTNYLNTPSKPKIHTGYRTYKEWIKLTPEQCKEILQQCTIQKSDGNMTKFIEHNTAKHGDNNHDKKARHIFSLRISSEAQTNKYTNRQSQPNRRANSSKPS
jgi:hypothetical protein